MSDLISTEDVELLGIKDILVLLKISRSTFDRARISSRGSITKFPDPDLSFGKTPRWRVRTVASWLEASTKSTSPC